MQSARFIPALLILTLLFAGCRSAEPKRPAREPRVDITWLGHECFKLTSALGITLITNPFDPNFIRYPRPANLNADVLLITNESSATNHTDLVLNAPQLFRSTTGVGSNRASGMLIRGVPTFEQRGVELIMGLNTVYSWSMDGVRFCHMGNLHYALTREEILKLGSCDVLFLPVGKPESLTNADRNKMIELLNPKIVVPMGYGTRYTGQLNFGSLNSWLSGQKNVVRLTTSTFAVSKDTLPAERTVMVPAIP